MICPNYSAKDFKAWEKKLGTFDTIRLWMLYNGELPSIDLLDFEDKLLGIPNLSVDVQKQYEKVLHIKSHKYNPILPGFSQTETEEIFNTVNGVVLYKFSLDPKLLSSADNNVLAKNMVTSIIEFTNYLKDPSLYVSGYTKSIRKLKYTQTQINAAKINRIKLSNFIKTRPETFFASYVNYLDSLRNIISIDQAKTQDGSDNKVVTETDVQGNNKFDWQESYLVSPKNSAPAEVKLVLAGLLDKYADGENVFNPSFLLPKTVDPNSIFNYLLNNITLVKFDKESLTSAIRAISAQKLSLYDLSNKDNTGILDTLSLDFASANLTTKFIQTFAKTKSEHILNLLKAGGAIHTIDSTNTGIRKQITEEWRGNMLMEHANTGTKITPEIIKTVKGYVAKLIQTKDPTESAQLLTAAYKVLGISFKYNSIEDFREPNVDIPGAPKMSREEVLVNKITNFSLKEKQDFFKISTGIISGLAGSEARHREDIIELQYVNANGEVVYASTLNGFYTIVFDRITNINNTFKDNDADRLEMLKLELPWLYTLSNQHSLIRKFAEEGKTFKVNIQGGIDVDAELTSEGGVAFNKLSFVDRYAAMITNILQGSYSYLRAGDRGKENGFSIMDGNNKLTFLTQVEGGSKAEYIDYMIGYLKDELNTSRALVQQDLGADISNYKDNAKTLRIFKNILTTVPNPKLQQNIAEFINTPSNTTVDDFVNKNFNAIDASIRGWLNNSVQNEYKQLSKNLVINSDGSINSKKHGGISTEILTAYNGSITQIIEDYFMNQSLAYMEGIKMITGDVAFYQFKGNALGDYVKRVGMFNGTKEISRVDAEFTEFLDAHFPRYDKKVGTSRDILKSVVVKDIKYSLGKKLLAKYESALIKSYKSLGFTQEQSELKAKLVVEAYSDINTTDGQGWISLDEYREIKLKGGKWSDESEVVYLKLIKGEKITDKELVYFHPLKTQYAGPETDSLNANEEKDRLYVPTGYKHSLFPLLPSLISREIAPVIKYMRENQVGIVQFDSATKFGIRLNAEGEINSLEDSEGNINLKNAVTQSIDYRFFGIQVQFEGDPKTEITDASQIRKNLLTNLSNQPEHTELVEDYIETVNKIILDPLEKVLDKIRGENLSNEFTFNDRTELVEMLLEQARSLNASDNVKLSTELLLNNDVFIDALASGGRVGQILLAHFRNKSTSGTRTGSAKVQVSDTALTFKKSESGKKDYLRFYEVGINGNTLRMEVEIALPKAWMPWVTKHFGTLANFNKEVTKVNEEYREFHSKPENKGKEFTNKNGKIDIRLLEVIGYRIPNQSVASSDAIIIRHFLPAEFGDSIFVPNGITTKSGADFDIDKLNLYLPTTVDHQGIPQYLNPENKDAFIQARKETKEKLLASINEYIEGKIQELFPEADKDAGEKLLRVLFQDSLYDEILAEDTIWTKDKIADLKNKIEIAGKTNFKLDRSTTLNHMLELEGKILLAESNFHQLVNPIDSNLLKSLSKKLNNDITEVNYDDMLKPYFNVIIGKYFLAGKHNIGIVAKNLTNNVICQLAKIYVNKEESDADLYFPHNTIKIDGKIYPDLSNPQAITKEYISDYIQQFLSAYVDIAKDPFIFHLNAGTETINTILYMIRLGADPKWVAHFMTQPVLKDYIQFKENYDSKALKTADRFRTSRPSAAKAFFTKTFNPTFKGSRPYKTNSAIQRVVSASNEFGVAPIIDSKLLQAQETWRKKQSIPTISDFETRQEDTVFQEMIFDQYLEYNRQAQMLTNFVQVTSPDTDSYQSLDEMTEMFRERERVENSGFFGNFENVFSDPENFAKPTLIGTFVTAHEKIKQAISELYMSQQGHIAPVLNEFKLSLTKNIFGLEKERALKLINNTFIDFLMANADVNKFSSIALRHLFIKENPNNLPKRIATIKSDKTHVLVASENKVLKLLLSDLTNKKQDNIKLLNKVINNFEERTITDAFRQIKTYSKELPADHIDKTLYENLIKFAYLQGGVSVSPISWTHIIPAEDSNSFIIPLLLEGLENSKTNPTFMENFKLKTIQNNPTLAKSARTYYVEEFDEPQVQLTYNYMVDGEEDYYESEYLTHISYEESEFDGPSNILRTFYKRNPIDPLNRNIAKFSLLKGIVQVGDGMRFKDLTMRDETLVNFGESEEENNSPITDLIIPTKKIEDNIDVPPTMGNIKPC